MYRLRTQAGRAASLAVSAKRANQHFFDLSMKKIMTLCRTFPFLACCAPSQGCKGRCQGTDTMLEEAPSGLFPLSGASQAAAVHEHSLPLGYVMVYAFGYLRKAGQRGVGHVLYGTEFSHEFSHLTEDRPTWDFGRKVA